MIDVALVCMPSVGVERPSLALSILKEELKSKGVGAKVYYSNIAFANLIGYKCYSKLSKYPTELNVFEWIFSDAIFKKSNKKEEEYLYVLRELGVDTKDLIETRKEIYNFLEQQVDKILLDHPKIVGCTSVFQQNCASLALLKKIKERDANIITFMGGANCEGSCGFITHKNCNWVDYIFIGEGDETVPKICKNILQNENIEEIVGVIYPAHRGKLMKEVNLQSARVESLEQLVIPNFDEYFEALDELDIRKTVKPFLLIETSRGCWWGEKKPCSFCSLNGCKNKYRIKSHNKVLAELDAGSTRYGVKTFEAVDNVIRIDCFETLIPELEKIEEKYKLLYETRANLTKEQISRLYKAGITTVQVGIESLQDDLLRLLNKGTTSLMNVQYLKWAMENNVNVVWNVLLGIPNDKDEYYEEISKLMPLLVHLAPPSPGFIRYDRFSDYFYNQEKYKLKLKPHWSYVYIYEYPYKDLEDFAYYLEDENHIAYNKSVYRVRNEAIKWLKLHYENIETFKKKKEKIPKLQYEVNGKTVEITDSRPCRMGEYYILSGLEKNIYLQCDAGKKLEDLINLNLQYSLLDIKTTLKHLMAKKILIYVSGKYLSLATKKSEPRYRNMFF